MFRNHFKRGDFALFKKEIQRKLQSALNYVLCLYQVLQNIICLPIRDKQPLYLYDPLIQLKFDFPMNPSCPSVGQLSGWLGCHNFFKMTGKLLFYSNASIRAHMHNFLRHKPRGSGRKYQLAILLSSYWQLHSFFLLKPRQIFIISGLFLSRELFS